MSQSPAARTLTAAELEQKLARKEPLTLLDVRRKADRDASGDAIPGAQWRDPERLQEWATQIPRDQEVVLYCARGGSVSNSVVDFLRQQGLNARFVEGGIAAWQAAHK